MMFIPKPVSNNGLFYFYPVWWCCMYEQKLAANVWKLQVIRIIRWFVLIIPVIVPFYQENGLSMTRILVLQSVFSIAVFVFEIPSGYFADAAGRKISVVFGLICSALGFIAYTVSYSFWGFLTGELIMGLGASFISGADSALLYDSLLQLGRQEEYKKIEGRLSAWGSISEGSASILGGLLAAVSLRLPLYAETALVIAVIPIALSLAEPLRKGFPAGENHWRSVLSVVKYAAYDNRKLRWIILYASVVGASTLTAAWLVQPYFKRVGLPIQWYGIIWAALQFSTAGWSFSAHAFESRFGLRRSLIALIALSVIGYAVLGLCTGLGFIAVFFVFYLVRGVNGPILLDCINRSASSDVRATVISAYALCLRLIFAIIGPVLGWITDRCSLAAAFGAGGLFFAVLGACSLIGLVRSWAQEEIRYRKEAGIPEPAAAG